MRKKINLEALKAKARKYAPAIIAVTSTVTAITAVLYYRHKMELYRDLLAVEYTKHVDVQDLIALETGLGRELIEEFRVGKKIKTVELDDGSKYELEQPEEIRTKATEVVKPS